MVEQSFIEAAQQRTLCKITDKTGKERVVEPYLIFLPIKRELMFHTYQISPDEGWRNFHTIDIKKIELLSEVFSLREDYNPFNKKMFQIVLFSIPTKDGRKKVPFGFESLYL